MTEQTLKEKTANGLFWGGVSNGLQQLLVLAFGIILARLLDAKDYGLIGMLAIFSSIATSLIDSGFAVALINKKEFRHDDYNAVFWFSLFIGIFLYILLFLLAPLIALFYNRPELTSLSRLLFIGFLFSSTSVAHNAILVKNMMVKERTKIDLTALLLSASIGITLAYQGFSYWALAIQTTSYIVIGSLLRWYYSGWHPTFTFHIEPLKEMFGFSSRILATNIVYQISGNLFTIILGKFYTPTQVGYYTQGNKWMIMGYSMIGGMISGIAQPLFVNVEGNKERQLAVFRKTIRFGALVSFPLMLGLAFIGDEFISLALGEKWQPAVLFLQICCIWGSIAFLWTLYTNFILSIRKSNVYFWGVTGVTLLQLLVLAIVYSWGVIVMVSLYFLMNVVGLLYLHYFVSKELPLRLWMVVKDISPYLIITLITFLLVYIILLPFQNEYLLLGGKIVLSALLYGFILWITNATIFREMVAFVLKKNNILFSKDTK